MTSLPETLALVVNTLQANRLFGDVSVVQEKVFSDEQFALKVRARMVNGWNLQVYLYHNRGHHDYAYQVFGDAAIMCWDNKEDCPGLDNFPHHHHADDGTIVASALSGEPSKDLPKLLNVLENLVSLPAARPTKRSRKVR
jgi:Family of unknown function (DUF6516)